MSSEFLSEDERAVVADEQIRAFFNETNDQNLAGAVVLSLLIYAVHDGIPPWTWQPALAALYLVTAVRAALIWQYHCAPGRRSAGEWGRDQAISGGLAGICWGAASAAMLPQLATEYQLVILTVITVAAASSASEAFSYVPPSRAFVLACIGPPLAWLLTVGDTLHLTLAAMLSIFLPMTLWQAHKRNRVFVEAQQLRFRNEALARELTVQRDAAQQATRAKARFLAAASHDLRQPMQALSIFHELLGQEIARPGRGAEILANARQAAESMNTLLDALLDVSRLDAGVIKAQCRPFPIQSLLDDMEREFAPLALQKGLRLRVAPCSAVIVSDPLLLGQVLRNLVSNAIRYTPAGRVLLGCRRRAGQLAVGVHDTGIGIEPEQHEAIFAEFHQVGNPARDRRQGLGLGLAIVERVARLLDHALSLRSAPGRGSCFVVSVPLAAAGQRPEPQTEAEPFPQNRLAGRRILLIDDDAAIRRGLCSLLQGWGCAVTAAASGAEALDGKELGAPDAVISDIGLPDQDNGIEAIAALRRRYGAQLPAVLLSGDTSAATLCAARAAGLAMLHKPVKPARLRAALNEALTAGLPEITAPATAAD